MQSGINAARLRVDGFVSLSAPLHSASGAAAIVVTRALRGAAGAARLELNVVTGGGGSLRVELLQPDGTPIEGFSMAESVPMVIDSANATALWSSAPTAPARWRLPKQAGAAGAGVQLRFELVGAHLYSFRLGGAKA